MAFRPGHAPALAVRPGTRQPVDRLRPARRGPVSRAEAGQPKAPAVRRKPANRKPTPPGGSQPTESPGRQPEASQPKADTAGQKPANRKPRRQPEASQPKADTARQKPANRKPRPPPDPVDGSDRQALPGDPPLRPSAVTCQACTPAREAAFACSHLTAAFWAGACSIRCSIRRPAVKTARLPSARPVTVRPAPTAVSTAAVVMSRVSASIAARDRWW